MSLWRQAMICKFHHHAENSNIINYSFRFVTGTNSNSIINVRRLQFVVSCWFELTVIK